MVLNCRACSKEIPESAIDSEKAIATCVGCGQVQIAHSRDAKTLKVGIPEGLEYHQEDDQLTFLVSSRSIWDFLALGGGLIVFLMMAKLEGPLLVAILATPFFYVVLTSLVNKHQIVVNERGLTIRGTPLPTWLKRDIARDQIQQIYVEQHIAGNHTANVAQGTSESYKYTADILTKNGKRHRPTPKLRDPDTCLFLEQEIEHFLNIEDQSVKGEMGQGFPY